MESYLLRHVCMINKIKYEIARINGNYYQHPSMHSLHRNGVYFEVGFALGLGKQVIYLSHKDYFEDSHFDIRQLQHIIYESPEDLEKLLIDKVNVWTN